MSPQTRSSNYLNASARPHAAAAVLGWLLLAAMRLLWDVGQETLASVSDLMTGIMYVTFIVAQVKGRRCRKAFKHESTTPASHRQSGR